MKIKLPFLLLAFCFSMFSYAQVLKTDEIETDTGELIVHPLLHATMILEWNGLSIYVDPYGGAAVFENQKSADIILITDIHGDHMNIETLEALDLFETPIITCSAVAKLLPESFTNVSVLNNNESTLWEGIKIEAIPMYNLPEDEASRHVKGRGNGYVLNLGAKRIYISGDTEDIPEMRALQNIDVAFVCMNQPYTMDVDAAASAVLEFTPNIVYPFHYRGGGGNFSDINKFKALVNQGNPNIDVRLMDWYPKKE
jgi:L-ascorbate metabolism protein UlaG (beta-lactamase superfamily)